MADRTVVQEFITKLREAEEHHDPTRVASLFSDDAKLETMTRPTRAKAKSPCTALHFWSQYLSAFDYVSSHFTNVMETDSSAVLEWHSSGRLPMGTPIEYCGVSILEHDGKSLTAIRIYYDTAAMIPNVNHAVKSYSETVGKPEIITEASS